MFSIGNHSLFLPKIGRLLGSIVTSMKTADRQLHIICALRRACNKSFFFYMHFMCTVYTLLKKDFSHKKTTWNHKSLSHRLTSFYHYHFYDFKFKQTESLIKIKKVLDTKAAKSVFDLF